MRRTVTTIAKAGETIALTVVVGLSLYFLREFAHFPIQLITRVPAVALTGFCTVHFLIAGLFLLVAVMAPARLPQCDSGADVAQIDRDCTARIRGRSVRARRMHSCVVGAGLPGGWPDWRWSTRFRHLGVA